MDLRANSHTALALFHLLVAGPFLIYVGLQGNALPDAVFMILGGLAAVIFLYHGYRAYTKISEGKSAWINWIHLLFVAPLFAYIAYTKKETPRRFFELALMGGFAAVGYHGFYTLKSMA
jgi:energy-coupling factor transporter transmembrane protein EcfT